MIYFKIPCERNNRRVTPQKATFCGKIVNYTTKIFFNTGLKDQGDIGESAFFLEMIF